MRTIAAAARELKKERATWDCWCVFFSLSFVVVKNAHPVKYNLLTAANVFCGPGRGFFFFARFSTFIDGKRLLPPPGIPAHVHRFFTDDLPAAALQTPFGLQNARWQVASRHRK